MYKDAFWAHQYSGYLPEVDEVCLGGLHLTHCIIYLDDIIVFNQTPEKHLIRLSAILYTFRVAGLKLKSSKYELFNKQINYLGHVVSSDGASPDNYCNLGESSGC